MSLFILGLMTGTSCDGLDATCVEFGANDWTLIWGRSVPYPTSLRQRVLKFQKPKMRWTSHEWLDLDRDLGDWYARVIERLVREEKQVPDLIANHGQTIAHFPNKSKKGATLQIGNASRIATLTGITVASDFRSGDLAAGGQGAPLVPLFHRLLAHRIRPNPVGLAIHNLGGISNLTYFGPSEEMIAFDTGPGNIWMDAAAEQATRGRWKFDRNGYLASLSTPNLKIVQEILEHSFFRKPAPKSTGRDDFPYSLFRQAYPRKGKDLVATATEVTIKSIARAYHSQILEKGYPLDAIYFCGGGSKNQTLLRRVQNELPNVSIQSVNQLGWNSQWIEAQAFAYFGLLSILGIPLGGSWTGARSFGSPGHLVPGKNWSELLNQLELFKKHLPNYLPTQSRAVKGPE